MATVQDEIDSINSRLDNIEAMLAEVESSQIVYEQIMAEADENWTQNLIIQVLESKEFRKHGRTCFRRSYKQERKKSVLERPQGSVDNTAVLSFGEERSSFEINLFAVSDPIANVGYEQIGTYTTDEYGLITVGDLPKGEYYFVEAKAPQGYIGSNEKIEFSVPDVRRAISTCCYYCRKHTAIEGEKLAFQ